METYYRFRYNPEGLEFLEGSLGYWRREVFFNPSTSNAYTLTILLEDFIDQKKLQIMVEHCL